MGHQNPQINPYEYALLAFNRQGRCRENPGPAGQARNVTFRCGPRRGYCSPREWLYSSKLATPYVNLIFVLRSSQEKRECTTACQFHNYLLIIPLQWAEYHWQTEICEILLQSGASWHFRDRAGRLVVFLRMMLYEAVN
jgi:hypothetical protein